MSRKDHSVIGTPDLIPQMHLIKNSTNTHWNSVFNFLPIFIKFHLLFWIEKKWAPNTWKADWLKFLYSTHHCVQIGLIKKVTFPKGSLLDFQTGNRNWNYFSTMNHYTSHEMSSPINYSALNLTFIHDNSKNYIQIRKEKNPLA